MFKSLLFSGTLLLSSALVFLVQFMCAKMVLPFLGGTPAVWNTCMVFFQAGLLLGYAYAHLAPAALGVRRHAVVHLGLLALAFFTLPVNLRPSGNPPEEPVFWLLGLLTLGVGLPFFLLSSSGPLVQHWFAHTPGSRDPYFLYAASNLGSMLGLLSYPFLIEPTFTLAEQNHLWTWSFALLMLFLAGCALCLRASKKKGSDPLKSQKTKGSDPFFLDALTNPAPQPMPATLDTEVPWTGSWLVRLRWVLLAVVPSSLMLSVTSYLTTDIAAIPLLWVVPLALYLFTLVLVFARHPRGLEAWMARWLPGIVLLVLLVQLAEGNEPIWLVVLVHLLGFYWVAVVCHGQLASGKPPPEHLTEFYLWLALGGVLGGLLNALIAPLVFSALVEYPLMLVLACWLNPREKDVRANLPGKLPAPSGVMDLVVPTVIGLLSLALVLYFRATDSPSRMTVVQMFAAPIFLCLVVAERPVRFSLSLAGILLAGSLYDGVHGKLVLRQRSFFGVHRVTESDGYRRLVHGNTVHGMQSLDPARRREALTYYYRSGPIGQIFTRLKFDPVSKVPDPRLSRVGLVGLGTGALATYAQPGQHWTFFEIDPAVVHIARDSGLFTFLADSPGQVDVVLGDARLTLEQSREKFGVLVIDAFGSDSIPLHLLTREALQVYRDHLEPGGLLAFHISHRYLDLAPVLANLAGEMGWACRVKHDWEDKSTGKYESIWALMAAKDADLAFLGTGYMWFPAEANPKLRPWTDDFSNIFQIMKLRSPFGGEP